MTRVQIRIPVFEPWPEQKESFFFFSHMRNYQNALTLFLHKSYAISIFPLNLLSVAGGRKRRKQSWRAARGRLPRHERSAAVAFKFEALFPHFKFFCRRWVQGEESGREVLLGVGSSAIGFCRGFILFPVDYPCGCHRRRASSFSCCRCSVRLVL